MWAVADLKTFLLQNTVDKLTDGKQENELEE